MPGKAHLPGTISLARAPDTRSTIAPEIHGPGPEIYTVHVLYRTIASEINAPHVYGKWKKTAVFARCRVRKPQYLHCAPWKTCGIRKGIERLHRPAVPASACTGPPNRPNGIILARLQRTGRELRAWRGGPGRGLFRARQPSRRRAATDQHAQLGASAAGSVMRIEKLLHAA